MTIQPIVLQVEDDEASYFIFSQLFEEICPDLHLLRAKNGVEALTLLRSLANDSSARLALVLLDVFLPLVNGWEVLTSMRAIEPLRLVPVVMFTGQLVERDRIRCAELDIEYIEKPSDLRGLVTLVKDICQKALQPQGS